MIQRKTKTPISKSTYAPKNVEGNISTTKVIEDLKKKKKNPNGISRGEKYNL